MKSVLLFIFLVISCSSVENISNREIASSSKIFLNCENHDPAAHLGNLREDQLLPSKIELLPDTGSLSSKVSYRGFDIYFYTIEQKIRRKIPLNVMIRKDDNGWTNFETNLKINKEKSKISIEQYSGPTDLAFTMKCWASNY